MVKDHCARIQDGAFQEATRNANPPDPDPWTEAVKKHTNVCLRAIEQYRTDQYGDASTIIGKGKRPRTTNPTPDSGPPEPKRKRSELELKLLQAKRKAEEDMYLIQLEEKRKMEDTQLKAMMEQRAIQDEIEQQQLADWFPSTTGLLGQPRYSSTPKDVSSIFLPPRFPILQPNAPNQNSINTNATWLESFITKMRLKPFDGSPKEWPHFIASYGSFVHETTLSDHQKLLILNDVLSSEVKKRMAHLLQSPQTYEAAIKELKARYGDKDALVNYHIRALLNLPICRFNDHRTLYEFSSQLHDTVATMQALGETHLLGYGTTLEQLLLKLPMDIRKEWGRHTYRKRPSIIELDAWLDEITSADAQTRASSIPEKEQPNQSNQPRGKVSAIQQKLVSFATGEEQDGGCQVCQMRPGHGLLNCKTFLEMTPTARAEQVNRLRNCFRCLGRGHYSTNCKKEKACDVDGCQFNHHSLLHGAPRVNSIRAQTSRSALATGIVEDGAAVSSNAVGSEGAQPTVLLSVLPVLIRSPTGWVLTHALLDTASESTLIRADLATRLNLPQRDSHVKIMTIHGQDPELGTKATSFTITSLDHSVMYDVERALVMPKLNVARRKFNWPKEKSKWDHLKQLPVAAVDSSQIKILIGMDIVEAHLPIEVRRPPPNQAGPYGLRTPLGCSIVGRIDEKLVQEAEDKATGTYALAVINPEDERNHLERFWSTESFGTQPQARPLIPKDDQAAIHIFETTVKWVGDRYEIGLPWKVPRTPLPNNYTAARQKLIRQEDRLVEEKLYERYVQGMEDYVRLGHARVVTREELKDDKITGRTRWYVPHHHVIHPQKPDKLRIVFNLSATHRGVSLNDKLLKGPDFYPNLVGVLLRFRRDLIAVSADIEKMFLQVRVKEEDQRFLSFFWRRSRDKDIETYQMMVQVFGGVSSPSSCLYVIRKTLEDNPEFGDMKEKICSNMFVDNYLDSFASEEEAAHACGRLTELLRRGGFRLNQWTSSSRRLLAEIPPSERNQPQLNLDFDELPTERMLGNWYDGEADAFCFRFKQLGAVKTMRQLVSAVASIFDPLGLIAPVTLTAKTMIQKTWKAKIQWDDRLPEELAAEWCAWYQDLEILSHLQLPRSLKAQEFHRQCPSFQMHVFGDASEIGFGAIAYARWELEEKVIIRIIMAKARVSPLKPPLTTNKLELQAAVLACRLASSIATELSLDEEKTTYWSDSQTVLRWINSKHYKFDRFTTNRVSEILNASEPEQWRHVPGTLNPADDVSRGVASSALTINHRVFAAPGYLSLNKDKWPPMLLIEQMSSLCTTVEKHQEGRPYPSMVVIERYSELSKVLRIVCRLRQTLWCWKARKLQLPKTTLVIEAGDFQQALTLCIRDAQKTELAGDLKKLKEKGEVAKSSRLRMLTPFIDPSGIIRVGGRLNNSSLQEEEKHPIILPEHKLTKLIMEDIHRKFNHCGPERTFYEVGALYRIFGGRRLAKRIVAQCVKCRRMFSRPTPPLMAQLPKPRVEDRVYPFANTGIDFFGPFWITIGRRKEKRYGCIFTCLSTRAVHLEVADNMDTDSFLLAFRRFVSFRGTPKVIYSDNGTNLKAGNDELKEGWHRLNNAKLSEHLAETQTQWIFSPPSAPHFGGAWERLIQSCKRALSVVLNGRSTKEEVLRTVFAEVAAILNARPLTHLSVDPRDPRPLTPNHFLLLRPHPHIPPDIFEANVSISRRRWIIAQEIVEHYWKRWMKEYVPSLIASKKWNRKEKNIMLGDVVLIIDDNSPRGTWPIGRVVELIKGKDGVVRSAVVKTTLGEQRRDGTTNYREYTRPVMKLCVLLTKDSFVEDKTEKVCGARTREEASENEEEGSRR